MPYCLHLKSKFFAFAAIALLPGFSPAGDADDKFVYPKPPASEQTDDYFGVKVRDPFRPLEDAHSEATRKWIDAENKLTFDYLAKIPERPRIGKRLTALRNYERYGVPFHEGGQYFFSKNTGLQNQSVLFVASKLPGEPRMLLDPNTLSPDGTVALSGLAVPDDGKLLAYGLATAGSDWQEWKVRDIASGKDLAENLRWVKFSSASWAHDGGGFFYSRYDAPKGGELKETNYFHKVFFHKIGTPQSEDTLVYERNNHKDWLFNAEVTDDGAYLIISVSQGTDPKNRVFYKDLRDPKSKVVELLDKQDANYAFIEHDGNVFWFKTDLGAPRGRIIAINVQKPTEIRQVVPESGDKLEDVDLVGERFVANYLHDAHSVVRLFELSDKAAGEIALPGLGTASGFTGKRKDSEAFYSYVSFTEPPTIYRYDFNIGRSEPLFRPKVDFKSDDYATEQVFYKSKDGTRVPMFLTYRKGLEKIGNNPTLLFGYGGFDISETPTFTPAIAVWLEMGGIYALANIRGGGEYGEEWHLAGTKLRKQLRFERKRRGIQSSI